MMRLYLDQSEEAISKLFGIDQSERSPPTAGTRHSTAQSCILPGYLQLILLIPKMAKSKKDARSRSRRRSTSRSRSRSRTRTAAKKSASATTTPVQRKTSSQTVAKSPPKTDPIRISSRIAAKEEKKLFVEKLETVQIKQISETKTIPDVKIEDEKKIRKTPKKHIGSVLGALSFIILFPLATFYLVLLCHKYQCSITSLPKIPKNWKYYFDPYSASIVVGWFLLQSVLAIIPVGRKVTGQPLPSGGRLTYRCNGFFALVVVLAMLGLALYLELPITFVYDKLFSIVITSAILAFILSIVFYIKSRYASPTAIAASGNTGNVIHDFFMGHELNPRIGPLDMKILNFRMSFLTWLMMDMCLVLKASQDDGGISPSIAIVTIFQLIYIADMLWFEETLLVSMDILHDGYGFMAVFGNMVWIPYVYCIQGLYLVRHKVLLPYYILALIAVLNFVGYVIYRGSTSQKYEFRKDPFQLSMAHLESIPSISGKRLLVSGWWKLCRKPNYLGDIIMSVAWSLTCGFGSIVPYFYPIICITFLILRERRDYNLCKKKHGISWDHYCNAVKYRIFPYIY
ncbi:delta(14)-sterol reductase TM7SF2 isoform X1 [Octopus bimaculoides]|uniref:delta(14)-sterol reductase TM7SF2 isoform X1 n=1 Tax=Octopus bimaculoides TaxID=37653 RepID=UPI00071C723A|nr:delta(14)-sterol reductase TM7SF2 isoform X1 [Octopus bimaculoides]|eukprot:XP_014785587.1 PREDICTED: delta(14)-sterol reductase-like isoform X1 [Octopus bimaculoides]